MTLLLATLCTTLFVAWFVSKPLLAENLRESSDLLSPEKQRELDKLERCTQLLTELEFDYSLKTVSDEDYRLLKESLERELAEKEPN